MNKKVLYKKTKVFVAVFLTLSLFFAMTEIRYGQADSSHEVGISTKNIHHQDYHGYYNWASVIQSYLFSNQDGTVSRVEATDSSVIVETYDTEEFTLVSSSSLEMELPLFGGFYAGEKYNYLVFGQENPEEKDDLEVFRVVQYDKEWNRVGSDGLLGANTCVPFDAGSLRMCECQDMLYVRTCHEMYASSDGYNHQANVTFSVRQSSCEITDSFTGMMNLDQKGYVSHSFNQFIKTDGTELLAVDHGDAYPRSIALSRYIQPAGQDTFVGDYDTCTHVDILTFPGNVGGNYTGAEVGGFEVSSTDYLVAYQSVDQQNNFGESTWGSVRNVYIGTADKENFTKDSVQNIKITSYEADGNMSASNPVLVKVSEDAFLLMWEVYDASKLSFWSPNQKGTDTIQYVMLDNEGNPSGEILTAEGALSDCQPVVRGDEVMWYVTDNSAPVFYGLNWKEKTLNKVVTAAQAGETESPVPSEGAETMLPISSAPASTTPPTGGVGTTVPPNGTTASPAPSPTVKPTGSPDVYKDYKVERPGRVVIKKCKRKGKKKAVVTWKKVAESTGYEVQYSVKSNFKKAKRLTTHLNKVTLSGLKAGKKYYVRVCAYRPCEGLVYGEWSKVRKI